jgi:hypothetical protein
LVRLSAPRLCFKRGALGGATFAATAVLLLAGCSGDNGVALGDSGTHGGEITADGGSIDAITADAGTSGDAGNTTTDAPSPGAGYSVTTGPVTLGPGEERVVCVDRRIPTDHAIDIVNIGADLTEGGHHLIFYKSNATEESSAPVECASFRGVFTGMVPLFIAQKTHTDLQFPTGVAYALPAAQMVRVELHFLNTSDRPLAVTGTVHLREARTGTVVDRANLMFYGNLNINIPPQSTITVGPTFRAFRATSPKIFGLTGHQHHRGTGVTIELGPRTGPMMPIYENHDWADPPLTVFDPPIATTAGQGLRYACTYTNPTHQAVGFGEGVNQEMCFLWAYYYPDMGFEIGIGGN